MLEEQKSYSMEWARRIPFPVFSSEQIKILILKIYKIKWKNARKMSGMMPGILEAQQITTLWVLSLFWK